MKKLFLLLLFLSAPVMAGEISTDTAILQAMDKVTGKVKKLNVDVGGQVQFGELNVRVHKCLTKTPEETPESAVLLTISNTSGELFNGWMFASNPALSALDDPVYDIWLDSCYQVPRVEELPEATETDIEPEVTDISDIQD